LEAKKIKKNKGSKSKIRRFSGGLKANETSSFKNDYGVRVTSFRGWPATSSAEQKPLPREVGGRLMTLLPDYSATKTYFLRSYVKSIKTADRQAHSPERSRRAEKKQKW
jgi:hypothetical protein